MEEKISVGTYKLLLCWTTNSMFRCTKENRMKIELWIWCDTPTITDRGTDTVEPLYSGHHWELTFFPL